VKRFFIKNYRALKGYWENYSSFRYSVYFVIVFGLLTFILSANIIPNQFRPELGKESPIEIRAEHDISVEDKAATEEARQKAEYSIPLTYTIDPRKTHQSLEQVHQVFDEVRGVLDQGIPGDRRIIVLRKAIPFPISEKTLLTLLNVSRAARSHIETESDDTLRKVMKKGVRENNVPQARIDIERMAKQFSDPGDYTDAITELAQEAIKPNEFPDWASRDKQAATIEKKFREEPITRRIEKGTVVVTKGEIISEEKMAILKDLGYFSSSPTNYTIAGMAILSLLLLGLTVFYLLHHHPDMFKQEKHLVLLAVILLLTLVTSKLLILVSGYLAPVAMASILIAILFDSRLALFATVILSLMVGLLTNEMRDIVVAFVGGCVSIFSVSRVSNRFQLTSASFLVAVANVVVILCFSLLVDESMSQFLDHALIGGINGLLCVILAIGILPFLEQFSGVTTPFRLMELADPNAPLLRNFLAECPGTYHHSIVVANLAENAAQAIKANSLLVRVGAYYHDIGKMRRPGFFIENQMGGENPHDKLNPTLSTLIVTAHTKDGLEMARAYKLPKEVQDIIVQHHGTRPVNYFYHQAVTKEGVDRVNKDDFRHEGPKPQSKEAAILMLADAAEAATRSLPKPTASKIEQTVNEVIRGSMLDGQLDECNLSFSELNILINTFIRLLTGMYHHRIEYPDMSKLSNVDKSGPKKGQVLRFGS